MKYLFAAVMLASAVVGFSEAASAAGGCGPGWYAEWLGPLAPFVESGGAGPRENATATVDADGFVTIRVGASVLGQGLAVPHSIVLALQPAPSPDRPWRCGRCGRARCPAGRRWRDE